MSSFKELLKRRAFTEKEFSEATRIDRIRMHLIDPDHYVINNYDIEYLQRMTMAYGIICDNYRHAMALKKLQQLIPTYRHAEIMQLIADAQLLYANVTERNPLFDKIMQRERIMKQLEFCEKTNRVREIFQFEKLLREIENDIAEMQKLSGGTVRELPKIMLSADTSLIHQGITNLLANQEEE